jgi:chemotaxis protein CheZ
MDTASPQELAVLNELRMHIEHVCKQFHIIRSEAASISQKTAIPDAMLHLQDVLQSTEDATLAIIDAAMAVNTIAEEGSLPETCKQKLQRQAAVILESCSFQDISGQRIKKVLAQINTLETQLRSLADISAGRATPSMAGDPLLNGPALSSAAPTQAEIDRQFKAAK